MGRGRPLTNTSVDVEVAGTPCRHRPRTWHGEPRGQNNWLSAPCTPASLNNTSDDRQKGSADSGSYHLANDGADAEAAQGWEQGVEDKCTRPPIAPATEFPGPRL